MSYIQSICLIYSQYVLYTLNVSYLHSMYSMYSVCPVGRYGVNCEKECHCGATEEECDSVTGSCVSGCGHGWTGDDCQSQ